MWRIFVQKNPRALDNLIRYFIIVLIYYVLCESMFSKYIFSSVPILKYSHEVIIYGLFFFLFVTSFKRIKVLSYDKVIIFLLIYIFSAAFMINRFDLNIVVLSIRTIYRYIVLYFLILNLDLSSDHIKSYIKHIKVCGIILLTIGLLQILLPSVINPIVSPTAFQIGEMIRDDTYYVQDGKAIFSLFERYDRYGSFLAIFIVLIFCFPKKTVRDKVILLVSIINIIYTYSRQSWIALATSLLILTFIKRDYIKLFFLSSIATLTMAIMLAKGILAENIFFGSPLQRFLQVFNSSFIQSNMESARLRIYIDVLPKFLHTFNIYTLIGLGIGNFAMLANSMTNNSLYMRYFLLFNTPHTGIYHIGDVYWVELLMEIGIIGIIILATYFVKAFVFYYKNYNDKNSDSFTKSMNLTSIGFIIILIIINFFGPSMLITSFSFFFWLILALTRKLNLINNLARRDFNVEENNEYFNGK